MQTLMKLFRQEPLTLDTKISYSSIKEKFIKIIYRQVDSDLEIAALSDRGPGIRVHTLLLKV